MIRAIMYENVGFQGRPYEVAGDTPVLPPPIGIGNGQASSIQIFGPEWVVFWEGINYDQGNDQLWISPPPPGMYWPLENLHALHRPHGNNHWGDRIRSVCLLGGGPTGDNDNRIILYPDGHWGGNFGLLSDEAKIRLANMNNHINPLSTQ